MFFGLWKTRYFGMATILFVVSIVPLLKFFDHRKINVRNYLTLLLQILVGIVLLELIGAAGIVDYMELLGIDKNTKKIGAHATPYVEESGETYQDIAYKRGIKHPPILFDYKTDRRGFRNPGDPEDARVYVLGDSIVVGATVPYEKTVTGLLQKTSTHNVISIALIGLSVQEQHQLLKEAELPIENRLVIQFVFEGNDLRDSRRHRNTGMPTLHEAGSFGNFRDRSFVNNLIVYLQKVSATYSSLEKPNDYSCTIEDQMYEFWWMSNSFSDFEDEQSVVLASISSLSKEIKQAGGTFAVVFVPSKFRVLHGLCSWATEGMVSTKDHLGPFRSTITYWSVETGIPLLDLTRSLTETAYKGSIPWYWGDTHMNEVGHAIAAEEILAWDEFRNFE